MLLGAGDDHVQAAWMPGPDMLAASVGLPPHALPGPDARMFVEQVVVAVRHIWSHTSMTYSDLSNLLCPLLW